MRLVLKMVLGIAAVTILGVMLTPSPVMISEAQATPAVPEPSSMALMAAGLGLVAIYRKVRKSK
jgi:hypothetical protein